MVYLNEDVTLPPTITIRPVLPEEKDAFVEMYLDGFGIPKSVRTLSYLGESIGLLIGRPSMHCLFAQIQDTLAAMAILYIHEGVGYLATAATLPAWRGHGCQRALLEARIAIAASAGCDLITGQTGITTISQHNMERVGLRIAYTKALWTPSG